MKQAVGDPIQISPVDPIFRLDNVGRSKRIEEQSFLIRTHDESDAYAHPGGLTVHLRRTETPTRGAGFIYLDVDHADELAVGCRLVGLTVSNPEEADYEKREGAHMDPDGDLVRLGAAVASGAAR